LVRKKDTLHEGPELLLCLNESTKEEAIWKNIKQQLI
jgi:hypothetical protein